MYLFLVVYAFACMVLIAVILLQSGKGGGLSSLGSANQGIAEALGATGAEKTLTGLTTYCAVLFITLALIISVFSSKAFNKSKSIIGNNPATAAMQQRIPGVPGAAGVPSGAAGVPSGIPAEASGAAPAPAPAAPVAPVPAAPVPAAPAPAQ